MLADATDNVDDNMTEVCIEAIAFLNKAKNSQIEIYFLIFHSNIHLGLLGKNQKSKWKKKWASSLPHAPTLLRNVEHYAYHH